MLSIYLVEVDSEETVRALSPDYFTLRKVPVRGVIVTARSSRGEFDFVSRFFAPGVAWMKTGDRLGAHRARAILGGHPGQERVHGVASLGARRCSEGAGAGRSRAARRAGSDGDGWGAGG